MKSKIPSLMSAVISIEIQQYTLFQLIKEKIVVVIVVVLHVVAVVVLVLVGNGDCSDGSHGGHDIQ